MAGRYQHKDKLHSRAKEEGYRSRASYKLLELNEKFRFLAKGSHVVDLGAAPGGWLQVAVRKVGRGGRAVGIDLERVEPFSNSEMGSEGVQPLLIVGDIREDASRKLVRRALEGAADVVLSDMSPKLSGVRDRDIAASCELVQLAFEFAYGILQPGGWFIAKVFPGPESDELYKSAVPHFRRLQRVTLKSSRATSNELYFVAQQYLSNV